MRFSNRERILITFMKKRSGQEFSLDDLIKDVKKYILTKPANFRQSIVYSMRKLKEKLSVFGIDLVTVSPVGRGNKAIYKIDEKISTFLL